jgi:hypothetical protein
LAQALLDLQDIFFALDIPYSITSLCSSRPMIMMMESYTNNNEETPASTGGIIFDASVETRQCEQEQDLSLEMITTTISSSVFDESLEIEPSPPEDYGNKRRRGGEHQDSCNRKRCFIVLSFLAFVVLLGGVFVAIGAMFGSFNNDSSNLIPSTGGSDETAASNDDAADHASDGQPWHHPDPQGRLVEIKAELVHISGSSVFVDPLSPQSQALDWLGYEDRIILKSDAPNLYQRYALLVIVFATNGQRWRGLKYDSWDIMYDTHECDFESIITCNDLQQIVILDLWDRRMIGRLPEEIGLLTHLTRLELGLNLLEGSVPEAVFHLTDLRKCRAEYYVCGPAAAAASAAATRYIAEAELTPCRL